MALKKEITPIGDPIRFQSTYLTDFIEKVNELGYNLYVPFPELDKEYHELKLKDDLVYTVVEDKVHLIDYRTRWLIIWKNILQYNYVIKQTTKRVG